MKMTLRKVYFENIIAKSAASKNREVYIKCIIK